MAHASESGPLWSADLFGAIEGGEADGSTIVDATPLEDFPVGANESSSEPEPPPVEESPETEESIGRLTGIFAALAKQPELLAYVAGETYARMKVKTIESPEALAEAMSSAKTFSQAFRYARLIERTLGEGTVRKLAPLEGNPKAALDIRKTLKRDLHAQTLEGQAERGYNTNIEGDYGIKWSLQKAGRDGHQNMYDANGHTLDGVTSEVEKVIERGQTMYRARISAPQTYDWRLLLPIGATAGKGEESVGGFGEGSKMLALVLLRDHGAKSVRYSSGDWVIEFSIEPLPKGWSPKEGVRGLVARKKIAAPPQKGNALEVVFKDDAVTKENEGEEKSMSAEQRAKAFIATREFFYSSDNPDFRNPTFENEVGGFKILLHDAATKKYLKERGNRWVAPMGRLYAVGQRTHYSTRKTWNYVDYLNIWTWKKTLPKDRDRGVVSNEDFKEHILKPIVESMTLDEAEKAVYDFQPLWDDFVVYPNVGAALLRSLCEKLEKAGRKLKFDPTYVADDFDIFDRKSGEKRKTLIRGGSGMFCPAFMQIVGMKSAMQRYAEMVADTAAAA